MMWSPPGKQLMHKYHNLIWCQWPLLLKLSLHLNNDPSIIHKQNLWILSFVWPFWIMLDCIFYAYDRLLYYWWKHVTINEGIRFDLCHSGTKYWCLMRLLYFNDFRARKQQLPRSLYSLRESFSPFLIHNWKRENLLLENSTLHTEHWVVWV